MAGSGGDGGMSSIFCYNIKLKFIRRPQLTYPAVTPQKDPRNPKEADPPEAEEEGEEEESRRDLEGHGSSSPLRRSAGYDDVTVDVTAVQVGKE